MKKWLKRKAGFTLVEIIVVLVILAILAAILIPSMIGWIDKANEKTAYSEVRLVALAAESAYVETYAECKLNGSEEVLYVKGLTSTEAFDGVFAGHLKEFVGNSVSFDDIVSVVFQEDYVYCRYNKAGVTYQYEKTPDGAVTISKL